MPRISTIVEGRGEISAVPVLLRRMAATIAPELYVEIMRPIRVSRHKVVKEGQLEQAVQAAANRSGSEGGILILLDADDDCPASLGPELLQRAKAARRDREISVVLAKREFESWLLASAKAIAGRRGLRPSLLPPSDPEGISDAKGWLTARSLPSRSYRPTQDQAALTSVLDFEQARKRSPSFDKLWRDFRALLQVSAKLRS